MKPAFTIVELLVVVTIIVVLLALLAPAMDRAIYQAELAVCGARLDATTSGALSYAVANGRSFSVTRLEQADLVSAAADKRPALRTMLGESLNPLLNCPLTGKVNVNDSRASKVYASYFLWFGWRYDGQKGMGKIGDRFTWDGQNYSVMASDINILLDTTARSNHPDRDPARMWNLVLEDQDDPWQGTNNATVEGALSGGEITISTWRLTTTNERGLLDNNFAYQDGSVRRVGHITWNKDPRLREVPNISTGAFAGGARTHLPVE